MSESVSDFKKKVSNADKNVVAIDFDGVIHKNSKGFNDGKIYDDLIDFIGSEESIGKTLGTDINNRKYTLPIILLLERNKGKEYDHVLNEIQNADSVDINSINLYMAKNGIFEIVENYFRSEIEAANKALERYLDNPPIKHLMELSRYFGAQINKLLVY